MLSRAGSAVGETWARVVWSGPGVPQGPLGWITTRAVFPLIAQPYEAVAEAAQLQDDDVLLDVACGAAVFLSEHGIVGVPPQPRDAVKWYMEAMAAGHDAAIEPLRDLISHLERAARYGDEEAQGILNDLDAVPSESR